MVGSLSVPRVIPKEPIPEPFIGSPTSVVSDSWSDGSDDLIELGEFIKIIADSYTITENEISIYTFFKHLVSFPLISIGKESVERDHKYSIYYFVIDSIITILLLCLLFYLVNVRILVFQVKIEI